MIKICSVVLMLSFLLYSSESFARSSFSAVVTKIIDGDSIVVKRGNKYIEVRLYGIDSPEWRQSSSKNARKYVKALIYKEEVTVTALYYDPYGRLVALIERDGLDVNGDLVKAGMAWVYPKYCRKKVCEEWQVKEDHARSEGKGLWAVKDPVSPWQWKKMHKR